MSSAERERALVRERIPKVSVCVVTYNQERYVAQCLRSLVEQQTDFAYEIIVGDDCSTDRTREIVQEFAVRYPYLIKPIFQPHNLGPIANIVAVYKAARGHYICHMDGDDYALPGKLQKQYDALATHPECVICSHDVNVVNASDALLRKSFVKCDGGLYSLLDLYERLPFFAHSSKMFVNDLESQYWDELHPKTIDIEIHVRQAQRGKIYHIDQCLGAYRVNTGMSSSAKTAVNPDMVATTTRLFEDALSRFPSQTDRLKLAFARAMFAYAYQSAVWGDAINARQYIERSLSIARYSLIQRMFAWTTAAPELTIWICQLRARAKGY